ncbi:MAG: AI-2E family transporter, partial [Eubacteriales bacterium]|nr:AI-2E family transporter [Eubacteriales bacterium]
FVNLFIGLIVAIYLLASRSRWRAQLKLVVNCLFKGKAYDAVVNELRFVDRTFTDYISGRILDSVIVGVIVYVACLIMGIQDAALIAVVNGITNIIPYFGPYIGAIPSALLIFIDDPVKCVWFIIFILVLQQVDGNIICPKILSSAVGLSSFWVLFSTLLFGGLFGFVGLLVGVPVFVVIYDLLKKLIYLVLNKRGQGELIAAYESAYHPPEKAKKKRVLARKGQDAE